MKISLIIMTLVSAGLCAAAPVAYNINFTAGTPNPTSGSFSYDSTTGQFSSFVVTWQGLTFNLTAAANASNPDIEVCTGYFNYLSGACGAERRWQTVQDPGTVAFNFGTSNNAFVNLQSPSIAAPPALANTDGAFTVTVASVATPEPTTVGMLAFGGALIAWKRRRHLASSGRDQC